MFKEIIKSGTGKSNCCIISDNNYISGGGDFWDMYPGFFAKVRFLIGNGDHFKGVSIGFKAFITIIFIVAIILTILL
jgi:hypothetical protein